MSPVALTAAAFGLGVVATASARVVAARVGVVRNPDPLVAQHRSPIPVLGGVAVGAAAGLTLLVSGDEVPATLWLGGAAFLVVGLADDLLRLGAATKLGLQLAAASVAVALGLTLHATGVEAVDAVLTVLWTVTLVNAVNFTDVCDGLVAGIAAVSLVALGAMEETVRAPSLAVAGACLGFLVFNAPPASIFLGDAGSHLLGFALAALPVVGAGESISLEELVAILLLVTLPLFELAFVVVARSRKSLPWWRGSSDHVALRLQAAGLTRWQTDLVAWSAAAALAVAAWSLGHASAGAAIAVALAAVGALGLAWRALLPWDPAR